MTYQYEHTNLPMSLLEITIRQGSWHELETLDDSAGQSILPNRCNTNRSRCGILAKNRSRDIFLFSRGIRASLLRALRMH